MTRHFPAVTLDGGKPAKVKTYRRKQLRALRDEQVTVQRQKFGPAKKLPRRLKRLSKYHTELHRAA